MTCFYCKGTIEQGLTTYMTSIDNCYIIIKNVPCKKCTQCGEEILDGVTALKIQQIVRNVRSMLTEIAIIDFSKAA